MTFTRPRLRHACLAAVLALSDVALALAYGNPAAWGLVALPAVALFLRLRVPLRFATVLVWISRLLIATLVVTGLDIAPLVGLALSVFAGLFLMDEAAFPPGRAVLPAALAVLLAAAFHPTAPHLEALMWACGGVMLLWLASGVEGAVRPRRLAAIALFAVPSAVAGETLVRFLPWAQPHVERTTARFITPQTGETGLGAGPWLGGVEQLTMVKRLLMRLWSDHPMTLRTAVYTRFNGRIWNVANDQRASRPLARAPGGVDTTEDWSRSVPGEWLVPSGVDSGAPGSLARVVVVAPLTSVLPAPAGVQAVRSSEPNMRVDTFGLVLAPSRIPAVYGFKHTGRPEPARDSDAALAADCLSLPPAVDPRVRALAAELGPATASVDEKIRRTVVDLQSRCRYSLKVGQWKTGDPVSEFLFDKKKGYCEYFATSAVLLLRLQGVPARYVTGFSVRSRSRRGDHFLVRASDAHAWAEVLVPGEGWVEVDATPPADYAAVQDELAMSASEELLEDMRARWSDFMARLREGGWGPILSGLWSQLGGVMRSPLPWIAAVLAASALWRRRRRRRTVAPPNAASRADDVDPALRACFDRLEHVWTRAGHPRPRHRAPLEHALALPHEGASLRRLSAEVVESFYRNAYGGQPIPPEETARLAADLERALRSAESPRTAR
jgi:transglutaminase-like putative cysteine protease